MEVSRMSWKGDRHWDQTELIWNPGWITHCVLAKLSLFEIWLPHLKNVAPHDFAFHCNLGGKNEIIWSIFIVIDTDQELIRLVFFTLCPVLFSLWQLPSRIRHSVLHSTIKKDLFSSWAMLPNYDWGLLAIFN